MTQRSAIRPILLSLFSSVLLVLSFPCFNVWPLAWVGLAPLMTALEDASPRRAFALAYLAGVLFFAGTLYWFVEVTVAGAILVVLYLALYIGAFGPLYVIFRRRSAAGQWVLVPSAWVALEYAREHVLSGFGWAALAHSQFRALPLIQISDITGFYGVSFLLVVTNLTVVWMTDSLRQKRAVTPDVRRAATATALLLAAVCVYGTWRMATVRGTGVMEAAVVQSNTPQEDKWRPSQLAGIVQKEMRLSREALATHPDVLIWPETSYPGYRWENPEKFQRFLDGLAALKTPVLFGAVTYTDGHYYNTAMLAEHDRVVAEYHKLHLVPFGEYIPFRHELPFLGRLVPIADFTPGDAYTLFDLPDRMSGRPARAAVLICFEDTVPELSRAFVRAGARVLINITNDAWFGNTNAPYMHLAAAVFRTVENRRSLVRAANTGVSGVIDPVGRIEREVRSSGRATYVAGWTRAGVVLNDGMTFYTRYGDVFAWLCIAGLAAGLLVRKRE